MDKIPAHSLTLSHAAVVRRTDALFNAMSADYLLREQFVTDPAQILFEYVLSRKLPSEDATSLNYLIFLVMSNERLVAGLRDRGLGRGVDRNGDGSPDGLTDAIVEHGDASLIAGLLRSPMGATLIRMDDRLFSELLRTLLHVADGTEYSGTRGGTEQSGTEQSGFDRTAENPGGEATAWRDDVERPWDDAPLLRADGTEYTGTGGGTQQSGTHVTEHSTGGGGTRGWVVQPPELGRGASLLQSDGTEYSGTGGGTQQSGTHVTEHSTGGGGTRGWLDRGFFGDRPAAVSLEALAQYATNLRRLGLLRHAPSTQTP